MPDRPPRRAVITFHEVAERQIAEMDDAALARLDPHLNTIALSPKAAGVQMRPDGFVHGFRQRLFSTSGGTRSVACSMFARSDSARARR